MRKKRLLNILMILCLVCGSISAWAEDDGTGTAPKTEENTFSETTGSEEEPGQNGEEDTVNQESVPEEESEEPEEMQEPEETLSGPEAFTDRMYRIVLGREKDEEGAAAWTEKLISGQLSGADVVYGFFMSPEMLAKNLSDEEYIRIAYLAILGREADEEGLENWMKVLDDGMSRVYVLKGFVGSAEFTSLCASYGITRGNLTSPYYRDRNSNITRFVSRLYTELLDRKGETDGVENWCRCILTNACTAASAIDGFLSSKEYIQKDTDDTLFVTQCYRVFFGREPDESGLAGWLQRLEVGMTRRSIERGLAGSAEFAQQCQKYGMTAGTVAITAYRDRSYELTKFVSSVYRGILGRKADTSGLEQHCRQLYTKNLGGKEIIRAFIRSAEYSQRSLSDEEFVQALYSGALGRSASDAEVSSNIRKMVTYGREWQMEQIIGSSEFASRCKTAGILVQLPEPVKALDSQMSSVSISGFNGWSLTAAQSNLLRNAVNTVEKRGYSIGFILLDLTSGKGISYHPDATFYSASAIKAPYIVSLAKYNYIGFTEVRATAADVLQTSSNTGYASLWGRFHGSTFAEFGKDAGVRSAVTADMYCHLSARELAKLWTVCDAYFNSGPAGNSVGQMCEDPNISSIRAVIPGNIVTRSKAGWINGYGERSSNDGGIVYAANGRYVIAVLSDLPASVNDLDPVVYALHTVHSQLSN